MQPSLRVAQINAGTDYASLCANELQLITQTIAGLRAVQAIGQRLSCRDGLVIELQETEGVTTIAIFDARGESITVYRHLTNGRIEIAEGQGYASPQFGTVRGLAAGKSDYAEYLTLRRMLLRYKDAYQDETKDQGLAIWQSK